MSTWLSARVVRQITLPIIVLVLVDRSGGFAAQVPQGRIEGSVRLDESLLGRRPAFRLYNGYGPGSVRNPSRPNTGQNSVAVYLEGKNLSHVRPSQPASIEQKDEHFAPHVTAIVKGTAVTFPNRDPFFHNVFSLSKTKSFDLGRYAQGHATTVTFDQPGLVQIYCQIHSDMSAYILVLENNFFAIVDGDGNFHIDDVPPGEYDLVAWHERVDPVRQRVIVRSGATTRLEIVMPMGTASDGG